TIQAAIDAANDGDTVVVSDGIYTGPGNRDIDFKGKVIIVRSENGPQNCIIDCQKSGRGFHFHSDEHYNSILDGFTITDGYAGYGGGIYCESSHPTITNCTFRDNTAQYWAKFSPLTPHENSSLMVNNDGEVHITTPVLPPGWRGVGGGICCRLSSPTLTNCKFIDNSANESGGGMYGYKSSTILTNCTFITNTATYGGAMSNSHGSPVLNNCTFVSNLASYGGAIRNSSSSPRLFNCIFSGNSAGRKGGCMYNQDSNPMQTNCTFNKNSADYDGGVIFNSGSDATLNNCILRGNRAAKGNEIFLKNYPDLWGSEIPSTINVDYSDVEEGAAGVFVDTNCTLNWGEGNIDADPCFVSPGFLDANGLWIEGDYHLLLSSPCIDAGDPNYVTEHNETDLDGRPRVMGGRVDMGAYEASIPAEVRIIPRTINLASKGNRLTCYIWLPEEYNVADVDPNSVFLEEQIKADELSVDEQKQVAIARFSRGELQAILDAGEVELTISGQLKDGTIFEATDVIRVIDEGRRKN
ncbi:MAG: choice-of-anchor Q domain-containing protein, partial [Planctomycetota bacterium]